MYADNFPFMPASVCVAASHLDSDFRRSVSTIRSLCFSMGEIICVWILCCHKRISLPQAEPQKL